MLDISIKKPKKSLKKIYGLTNYKSYNLNHSQSLSLDNAHKSEKIESSCTLECSCFLHSKKKSKLRLKRPSENIK